ncbi:hypothetical protein BDZ91DRAFT_752521 [Kalaharituber pfeilii]|nr:hypothetical protein BDZ91DRAFT_752521 [Kalaharituber pfeilii]
MWFATSDAQHLAARTRDKGLVQQAARYWEIWRTNLLSWAWLLLFAIANLSSHTAL